LVAQDNSNNGKLGVKSVGLSYKTASLSDGPSRLFWNRLIDMFLCVRTEQHFILKRLEVAHGEETSAGFVLLVFAPWKTLAEIEECYSETFSGRSLREARAGVVLLVLFPCETLAQIEELSVDAISTTKPAIN